MFKAIYPVISAAARCFWAAFATALCAGTATAGTLQVNPVLVQIDADHRTGSVTVRNMEAVPVTIHAYPLAWAQAGGQDRYDESAALIVSPPVFTVAPQGAQVVRVGLRNAAASGHAYRLIVEEVPEATPGPGIRVALRLNIPLYANVPAGSPGALRWTASPLPDGGWAIEATNNGAGYVRVEPETATAATGIRFGNDVALGTVLPGATRHWQLGQAVQIADRARLQQILRTPDRDAIRTAEIRH
jgi:fimbrial chaperone protein